MHIKRFIGAFVSLYFLFISMYVFKIYLVLNSSYAQKVQVFLGNTQCSGKGHHQVEGRLGQTCPLCPVYIPPQTGTVRTCPSLSPPPMNLPPLSPPPPMDWLDQTKIVRVNDFTADLSQRRRAETALSSLSHLAWFQDLFQGLIWYHYDVGF